jgi:glycosyltransferase involved in cell wall biosynthesis
MRDDGLILAETGSEEAAPAQEVRTNIVHVISPALVGGAESVVNALAQAQHAAGANVAVVALRADSSPNPMVAALRSTGVTVHEVVAPHRHYRREVIATAECLVERKAAVVHTHIYHADFVGYLAARRLRLPVIATYHGHTRGSLRNRVYEWADRRLLRRFAAVICVSERNRERLLRAGCPSHRLAVVRNRPTITSFADRVSARAILGIPPDARVVGWVGRLSHEKGPDIASDVAREALGGAELLLMVGDGPMRPSLTAAMQSDPRPARARLAGAWPNIATLLGAFDLLVISSRSEGLPMVLLEAMAAGVPIVTFAVGGIPEVVDQQSAWVVPAGDQVALARAIREALDRPDDAHARSLRARAVLDTRFSAREWVAEVDAVYRAVLHRPTLHGRSEAHRD